MGQNRKKGEPVAATSPDLVAERIAQLRELFPDVLSEGKVDVEKLRAALGEIADDRPERYSFSWAGKRDAIRLLQTPSRATLVPAPDESVNFDSTQNVFIEGDNLEVLKLLYKSYAGRVKMIYIDPPYNRPDGEDLIYNDNFADPLDPYLRLTGQKDEDGNLLTSKPETSGRLHSAWLTSIYPRLFVARQLLQEDGVIFVSIDDSELCNLRAVMNEVFGEENWVGTIVWKGATDNNPTQIAIEHEYILCYGRQKSNLAPVWKNLTEDAKTTLLAEYARLRKLSKNDPEWIQGKFRRFIKANAEVLSPLTHYSQVDERGPYTGSRKVHNPKPGGYVYDVIHPVTKKVCVPPANGYRFPRETMDRLLAEGRILFGKDETQIIQIKEYLEDYEGKLSSVISLDSRAAANEMEDLFGNRKLFPHPKPSILLRQVFDFCVSGEDLVLDFYAGSCSTAHAILENNRHDGLSCRFIMVQLQEPTPKDSQARKAGFRTIAEIGKERIRRVIKKMKKEAKGKLDLKDRDKPEDLGFRVFKLTESHFRRWSGTEENDAREWAKQMELFVDPLLPGWDPVNVIHEVALKEGYSLTSRIEQVPTKEVKTNNVYRVTDEERGQSLLICLDDKLKAATPKALGLKKDDVFICRDVALSDELAANLALQCRLKTI